MNKINPIIKTKYTFSEQAILFSILLRNTKSYNWFYSNFILPTLFIDEGDNCILTLGFKNFRFGCPTLRVSSIPFCIQKYLGEETSDVIKKLLLSECSYILISSIYDSINACNFFNKYNNIGSCILYGFDDDLGMFFASCIADEKKIDFFIPYDELNIITANKTIEHIFWAYFNETSYNKSIIKNQLLDYINGKNSALRHGDVNFQEYNKTIVEQENCIFGIGCFEKIGLMYKNKEIDKFKFCKMINILSENIMHIIDGIHYFMLTKKIGDVLVIIHELQSVMSSLRLIPSIVNDESFEDNSSNEIVCKILLASKQSLNESLNNLIILLDE